MATTATGAFEPTRLVTGREAIDALDRLRVLANVPPGLNSARP
jgi:hypothetical protein